MGKNRKPFQLPHRPSYFGKKTLLLGYMLESFNQPTKILLGDFQMRFQGDAVEKT